MYWCPECGSPLYEETSEDLYCKCGFRSSKSRARRTATGFVWRESYRTLKKVYDWNPPVLLRNPKPKDSSEFDPSLLPFLPNRDSSSTQEKGLLDSSAQKDSQMTPSGDNADDDADGGIPLLSIGQLSSRLMDDEEIEDALGSLVDNRSKLKETAFRGLKLALSSSDPLVSGIVFCRNIRKIVPRFLMRKRETSTMPRFMAKVLVGTTAYNLSVSDYEEYRILEEGTRHLFNAEPPEPRRVFLEISHYDKGIKKLARRPDKLQSLISICGHYLECSLIMEDIIEGVVEVLEEDIGRIKEKLKEADADSEQNLRRALSNASLCSKLAHLALTILRY